jgi:cytochrome c oxidase subunit 1
MLDERLGKLHFWITYPAFFFTFFPQHLLGMMGMPRRVAVYAPEFQTLNVVVSIASFALGISTFVLLYNMWRSMVAGKKAGANPWRALTLEWATSSPPPSHNFIGDPIIYEDPYGFGTEGAARYVDTLESRFGPALPDEVKSPTPPAPEPASGD